MTWLDWVAMIVIFAGLFCAVLIYSRHTSFIVGMGAQLLIVLRPYILSALTFALAFMMKRNTPEVENEMAECVRRGGEWDNFNKKCRYR